MEVKFQELIEEAERNKIFHTTTRKFGDSDPHSFVSMHLEDLSVESIVWAIRSLKLDKMTPNEKLILSKIKEANAFKLN